MRKEWLSGLVVLMMWSGCTPITGEIDASSYDNSCLLNGDCVTIREGDACDECGCDNAAINRRDRSLYERDYERASNTCATPGVGSPNTVLAPAREITT